MTVRSIAVDATAAKLVNAVTSTAAKRGVNGLSSRVVAEAAGVSASAVNYAFGSLDQLMAEASRQADDCAVAYWQQQGRELETLEGEGADIGPALFFATREMVERLPGEQALFWSAIITAARMSGDAGMGAGLGAERAYWRALLVRHGLASIDADLVQAFSLALRFAYRVNGTPGRFDPWAMALVQRFAARLSGDAPLGAGDSAYRRRAEYLANLSDAASVPEHETARSILTAAVQTILEDGVDAATFREIARRAGLSVSSVQHFFGSRRNYLMAAFQSIYAGARDQVVTDIPVEGSLTARELSRFLSRESLDKPALATRNFAAMQGLMLSAAYDPDTRVLAEGLLARMGQSSSQILKALASPRGPVSRLDAQIFSMVMSHLVTLDVSGAGPGVEAAGSSDRVCHLLEVLFGS